MRDQKPIRLICLSLALLLLLSPVLVQAERTLIPELNRLLTAEDGSLSLTVSIRVRTRMPFDSVRSEQLDRLLKHLSLTVRTFGANDVRVGQIAVSCDGKELFCLSERVNGDERLLWLSDDPDTAWSFRDDGDEFTFPGLTTGSRTTLRLNGFDGTETAVLSDAYRILCLLSGLAEPIGKTAANRTVIQKYGAAASKITLNIPKDGAGDFAASLRSFSEQCADSRLRTLFRNLTMQGNQKLSLLLREDGTPLKLTYSGRCGVSEEDPRDTTLTWSALRGEDDVRDRFELRSPAVKGKNRTNITFGREITDTKEGTEETAELKLDCIEGKVRTVRKASISLLAASVPDGTKVTGSCSLSSTAGDGETQKTVIEPDFNVFPGDGLPGFSGQLVWRQYTGKRLTEDATLTFHAERAADEPPSPGDRTVKAVEDTAEVSDALTGFIARDLIRALVTLPAEDTGFLSQGLPEDLWNSILEIAGGQER